MRHLRKYVCASTLCPGTEHERKVILAEYKRYRDNNLWANPLNQEEFKVLMKKAYQFLVRGSAVISHDIKGEMEYMRGNQPLCKENSRETFRGVYRSIYQPSLMCINSNETACVSLDSFEINRRNITMTCTYGEENEPVGDTVNMYAYNFEYIMKYGPVICTKRAIRIGNTELTLVRRCRGDILFIYKCILRYNKIYDCVYHICENKFYCSKGYVPFAFTNCPRVCIEVSLAYRKAFYAKVVRYIKDNKELLDNSLGKVFEVRDFL